MTIKLSGCDECHSCISQVINLMSWIHQHYVPLQSTANTELTSADVHYTGTWLLCQLGKNIKKGHHTNMLGREKHQV